MSFEKALDLCGLHQTAHGNSALLSFGIMCCGPKNPSKQNKTTTNAAPERDCKVSPRLQPRPPAFKGRFLEAMAFSRIARCFCQNMGKYGQYGEKYGDIWPIWWKFENQWPLPAVSRTKRAVLFLSTHTMSPPWWPALGRGDAGGRRKNIPTKITESKSSAINRLPDVQVLLIALGPCS